MFEVRCIVGDKKLHDALRSLQGHTLEPPVVIAITRDDAGGEEKAPTASAQRHSAQERRKTPVVKRRGKYGSSAKGTGAIVHVRALLATPGKTTVTAKDLREVTMGAGYSKNAYSHALKILLADKSLKHTGETGVYHIVRKEKAPSPVIEHHDSNDDFKVVNG